MSLFIGLMSGTSIDAIDAVLVEWFASSPHVIAGHRHAWPAPIRAELLRLSLQAQAKSTLHELATLDSQLGELFAEAVLSLLKIAKIEPQQIRAIGSPGQTVYHHPNGHIPYTWQLGDPNIIAQRTRILTVADFRRRDMAAGGQGAPLAPSCHRALLHHPQENRIVLNLGGIANVTVLPADSQKPIIGFDTGPSNTLLDAWCQQHCHTTMDVDGQWASTGYVSTELLDRLLTDPYFSRLPPKSTGRDYFNLDWLTHYLTGFHLTAQDIQATLCQLTIQTVLQAISPYQPDRLLVCGGGVHNLFLMQGFANALPHCPVESTSVQGVNPDWVEAISFAWFAKQRLENRPSNLPSVTGACESVPLGAIYI